MDNIQVGEMNAQGQKRFKMVDIEVVVPNPTQPRTHFDDEEIERLSQSIKEFGVIEPVILTEKEGGKYMLIAGERRFRAAIRAGQREIPAIIEDIDRVGELSLIENIHRVELTHPEKGLAVLRILKAKGVSSSVPEIIKALQRVRSGNTEGRDFPVGELVKALSKHPRTIIEWMKSLLVDEEILRQEREVQRLSGGALARLSTFDGDEQRMFYNIIKSENIQTGILGFISQLKKMDSAERKKILSHGDIQGLVENTENSNGDVLDDRISADLKHTRADHPHEDLDQTDDYLTSPSEFNAVETNEESTSEISEDIGKLMGISGTVRRHVDKVPPKWLYFERSLWNLRQFRKNIDFITTGTDGKDLDLFIRGLKVFDVERLLVVDVRDTPFSRFKPEFNKWNLKTALNQQGIDYIHRGELGVVKSLRNRLYRGDLTESQLWEEYRVNVLTEENREKLLDTIKNRIPVFVCTEISPERCHRNVIAKFLNSENKRGIDF